ncbi:MAG: response regulator transcription factor [Thiolinea sp.]
MRVLIIDSYPLFREAIALQIAKVVEQVSVFEVSSAEEAAALMSMTLPFDLVIASLDKSAYAWLKALKNESNYLAVVLFLDIKQAFVEIDHLYGINGLLAKSADLHEVKSALRLVLMGETYISPSLLMAKNLPKTSESVKASMLTPRQLQVLKLIAAGCSNKDIANELHCSDGTIKLHVSAILKEFKVSNRIGAIKYAAKLGLIINA